MPPGAPVTKYEYDGAGRLTKTYTTDAADDDEWSDADDVDSDNVFLQVDVRYDLNDNDILLMTRQRFDETTLASACGTATTGVLKTPVTCPAARVSYVGRWFDQADRLTDIVDYGTNGGSAPGQLPQTPPGRDDTHLVTSYRFKADEVQTVTVTGSPSNGNFKLTFDAEPTDDISANASAMTVEDELEELDGIADDGDVLVTGPDGGPWKVRFVGAFAEANVPTMTDDDAAVGVITSSEGGDTGRMQKVIDPRGIVTKTDYDMLGRMLRTVEAFVDFDPSDGDDRTTEYTYDSSGHILTLTAMLPDGEFQQTEYVYGVEQGTGESDLFSNDLLAFVKYPDKATGAPSDEPEDQEAYHYNALGQVKTKIDRNQNATEDVGTTHGFSYDVLGRPTSEAITVTGDGLDDNILRLDTAYDTAGRPSLFTSCSSATSCGSSAVENQVLRQYNGLGQMTAEYQEHGDEVDTGTSLNVQYAYSEMSNGTSYANHSRLTGMTYPNGTAISYVYDSGVDNTISRLSSITSGTTTLEQYSYLGLDTVIKRTHPRFGNDIGLTYLKQGSESNGDAGDPYNGLDRFGRVVDQRWIKSNDASNPLDRFQYGHDRNGNRMYRDNVFSGQDAFDELYHADGTTAGYDSFNQLIDFQRGAISDTNSDNVPDTSSDAHSQSWDLDTMGNWESLTTDGGTPESREHNRQNQVTDVGSNELAFDDNGNTTTDENGNTLVYDAWNRLIEVVDGSTVLVWYEYDALGRRIQETGSETDFYYSDQWQVLEERVRGDAYAQYVWSPVYVDAMIARDRDANAQSSDGLEERVFVMQDANWNVTGIMNPAGTVLERYVYDPYGAPTRLTASWDTPGSDTYNWVYLHQGGRFDAASALYQFRNRELSPTLGRWMQVDPIRYDDGLNLYRYAHNAPGNLTDPFGKSAGWHSDLSWQMSSVSTNAIDLIGLQDRRPPYPIFKLPIPGPAKRPIENFGHCLQEWADYVAAEGSVYRSQMSFMSAAERFAQSNDEDEKKGLLTEMKLSILALQAALEDVKKTGKELSDCLCETPTYIV